MRRLFIVVLPLLLLTLPLGASAATRSLVLGNTGSDVTALQQALVAQGYLATGYVTGYFGPLTQAAVEKFQCAQKIICAGASVSGYGIYGPETQASIQIAQAPQQPDTVSSGFLTPAATGRFEISGWVPYWSSVTSTADALPHLSQMTSVMPFGYTMNSDGTLADTAHLGEAPWTSFIATAKAKGVRVVPTVMWGDGNAIQAILSDTPKRIALENEIADTVKQNNFDGIDIDFEAKEAQTINYFSTFLQGLYARMGNKWLYCTVEARMPLEDSYSPGATIPADATERANDFMQMNKYCDRVEIMAYDQGTIDVRLNATRSAPYAPVADPDWVGDLIELAGQTISRNKLIVGIPTYGYEYQVTPLANSGFQYSVLWALTQKYALQIASQLGITPNRTSADEIGFTYDPKVLAALAPTGGNTTQSQQTQATTTVTQNLGSQVDTSQPFNYITWSDAQAIADKVALAHKLGVRGVAVFSFGEEDQNMWSVLK